MSFRDPFVLALLLMAAALWLVPDAPQTTPLNGPVHILTQER